jgi:hypothetical protein
LNVMDPMVGKGAHIVIQKSTVNIKRSTVFDIDYDAFLRA